MSQTDPYAPPQASLAGLTPSEQADRDSGVLRYSGFWPRLGAVLIDSLILAPLVLVSYLFNDKSQMFDLYLLIPTELISAFMYVYMVVKYGGSPGKLLLGIRIVKVDGSRVNLKEAVQRYAVLWALNLGMAIAGIKAALEMAPEDYKALGYWERSEALDAQEPMLAIFTWLVGIWIMACLVVMLSNKRRRSLHDFIAGTVVVRK